MKGFSLVEVMVCVLVMSLGLCGLIGVTLKSIHLVNMAINVRV